MLSEKILGQVQIFQDQKILLSHCSFLACNFLIKLPSRPKKQFQFTKVWGSYHTYILQQKQFENEQALKHLRETLTELDSLSWEDRQMALVKGLLAGNVFDWGAKEVAAVMETQEFGFSHAKEKLQGLNFLHILIWNLQCWYFSSMVQMHMLLLMSHVYMHVIHISTKSLWYHTLFLPLSKTRK